MCGTSLQNGDRISVWLLAGRHRGQDDISVARHVSQHLPARETHDQGGIANPVEMEWYSWRPGRFEGPLFMERLAPHLDVR